MSKGTTKATMCRVSPINNKLKCAINNHSLKNRLEADTSVLILRDLFILEASVRYS